jgi:GTP-dependent phosphoenolpyruvate carboxykinase
MPRFKDLDWRGLHMTEAEFAALTRVDIAAWKAELEQHEFSSLCAENDPLAHGTALRASA